MNGKYVSHTGSEIILSHEGGSPDTRHVITGDCAVTLNGRAAKLGDLHTGDDVGVGNENPATHLTVIRFDPKPHTAGPGMSPPYGGRVK